MLKAELSTVVRYMFQQTHGDSRCLHRDSRGIDEIIDSHAAEDYIFDIIRMASRWVPMYSRFQVRHWIMDHGHYYAKGIK